MSSKFDLDKYYTPSEIVNTVIDILVKAVGIDFDVVIEPSAGGGAFIGNIDNTFIDSDKLFYDLQPTSEGIIQQDYLELDTTNLMGKSVLVMGNPPFGTRNTLSVRFFKKSIQYADTIAFILPISQLNNNQQMFEYDLVSSNDIGEVKFFNHEGDIRPVKCCFNIYKKPMNGTNNKKPTYKYSNFKILEYRRGGNTKSIPEGTRGICAWGASLGKETEYIGQYVQERYFIGDKDIVDFCMQYDWLSHTEHTATPALYQWVIYEEVKKRFTLYNI